MLDDLLTPGDRIEHATLGFGTVVQMKPDHDGVAVIRFDKGGKKELLLAFCQGRLRKVQE